MNVKRYFKLHTHIVVIFLVFLQQWTKILQKTNCYEEFHLIFGFSFEIGQNIPRSIISITEGWSIDRPSVAFRMESYCQWWMQLKIEPCLGNVTEWIICQLMYSQNKSLNSWWSKMLRSCNAFRYCCKIPWIELWYDEKSMWIRSHEQPTKYIVIRIKNRYLMTRRAEMFEIPWNFSPRVRRRDAKVENQNVWLSEKIRWHRVTCWVNLHFMCVC